MYNAQYFNVTSTLFKQTLISLKSHHHNSFVRCLHNSLKCNNKNENLKPHVTLPYSYCYGRSTLGLSYIRLADLLTKQAEIRPNKTALTSDYENITKTYGELNTDVNKLAKGLLELGLKRGDVVGLWSANTYYWQQIQFACARIGLIQCSINPAYLASELDYVLRNAQVKMLFMPGSDSKQGAVNNFAKVFDQVLSESNKQNGDKLLIEKVIIMDGDKYKLDNLNKLNIPEYLLSDLIANDGIIEQNVLDEVTSDDPAIIMFTSGTTGKPKGAYLTHFTLGNNALIVANSYDLDHDEKSLCLPLPFFHTFGLLGNLGMCATPYKLVIPNCKYNVKQMVESMARNECSYLYGTPTMIIDTVNYLESNKLKLPSLRGLIAGGSPMPKEVAYRVQKVIPSCTDVRVAWGATEAGCSGSLSRQSDSLYNRIETVGRPIDHMETKIVNQATRQITKIGEPGEIESRGHNQMIGYWRNPKSTHDAIDASGWYKSGDLAVMTEEGFIKIIGRTKEMIIRGGENIYPREVEELLHSHPAIRDAYVCGVPDDRMGEELCAWIQVKDAAVKPTESEVKEFCKQKIAHFKVPRYVLFVDSFPLTPAGKVKKFVMREESCGILGLTEK